MTRTEGFQHLSREEIFLRQISYAETVMMRDFVGFLLAQRNGSLGDINWALFLAGDFADSFDHHVAPEGIDLRVVVDAPIGSELQKSFIKGMEAAIGAHLAQSGLSYIQKTGDNWHMARQSFDTDCHEYEKYIDDEGRHNDIRFVIIPNQAKNQRRIDIIINRICGRNIEAQLEWEKTVRQRQPVVLADSRRHRSYI